MTMETTIIPQSVTVDDSTIKENITGQIYVDPDNIPIIKTNQIYTLTGFDSTISSNSSNTDDHEFTEITASTLTGYNYLKIRFLINCVVGFYFSGGDLAYAQNRLQIQTKKIGGVYADSMAVTTIQRLENTANAEMENKLSELMCIEWIHTLTADEKTSGVQVKALTTSTVAGATNNQIASITNKQTVIQLLK